MGHETQEDKRLLDKLEAELDLDSSPADRLVELGVFYIEPFHQEDCAIKVFQKLIARFPENHISRIWLAFCHIHYSMDKDSLREALQELDVVIAKGASDLKAAAYMLKSEVLDDLELGNQYSRKELLEQSVSLAPAWTKNRYRLAWANKSLGNSAEALEQMRRALEHMEPAQEQVPLSKTLFEEMITSRWESKRFFNDQYDELLKSI